MNFTLFVSRIEYPARTGSRVAETAGYHAGDLRSGLSVEYGSHHRAIESTTAEVRKANIALLQADPGFLATLSSSLDSITNALDSTVRTVRDFLFGRNLVVPQGFSSARAHQAVFPSGTGAEELAGQEVSLGASIFGNASIMFSTDPNPDKHSVTVRIPGMPSQHELTRGRTNQPYVMNHDEYITKAGSASLASDLEIGMRTYTSETPAERLYRLFEETGRLGELEADPIMNQHAVTAFKTFGIDISEITEEAKSASGALALSSKRASAEMLSSISQMAGRTLYGALSMAAMKSSLNANAELQATITNPNTGNLTSAQLADLQTKTSAALQSEEQRKLAAEATAAELRGNTGTKFNTLELVLDAIL